MICDIYLYYRIVKYCHLKYKENRETKDCITTYEYDINGNKKNETNVKDRISNPWHSFLLMHCFRFHNPLLHTHQRKHTRKKEFERFHIHRNCFLFHNQQRHFRFQLHCHRCVLHIYTWRAFSSALQNLFLYNKECFAPINNCYSFNWILSIPPILREHIYIKFFSICVCPDNFNGILITFIFSKVSLFQRAISEQG